MPTDFVAFSLTISILEPKNNSKVHHRPTHRVFNKGNGETCLSMFPGKPFIPFDSAVYSRFPRKAIQETQKPKSLSIIKGVNS